MLDFRIGFYFSALKGSLCDIEYINIYKNMMAGKTIITLKILPLKNDCIIGNPFNCLLFYGNAV